MTATTKTTRKKAKSRKPKATTKPTTKATPKPEPSPEPVAADPTVITIPEDIGTALGQAVDSDGYFITISTYDKALGTLTHFWKRQMEFLEADVPLSLEHILADTRDKLAQEARQKLVVVKSMDDIKGV